MTPSSTNAAESASIWRSPYTKAVLVCLVVIPLMRPLLRFEPAPPKPLFALPTYSLVDSEGRVFGSAELSGKVYIASFMVTGCRTVCPELSSSMAMLQQRFEENAVRDVHLVSVSVDPEVDTPQRLAEYARSHAIDSDSWSLLTGPAAEIRSLVSQGFRIPLGDGEHTEHALADVAHRSQVVLVDRHGQVRGFYDVGARGLDEVFHRAQHVLEDRRDKQRSAL